MRANLEKIDDREKKPMDQASIVVIEMEQKDDCNATRVWPGVADKPILAIYSKNIQCK